MKEAASLENFELRAADVLTVLDQLEAWNTNDPSAEGSHGSAKRSECRATLSVQITTQAVSGENFSNYWEETN